jgi:alanine-glyoxylate transaminase/serine-glyoxylate transaminase/serine-pyruvate transaminase
MDVVTGRKGKVQSWYLDVNLLASYWGEERVYHHTAPISMNYALHEALRLVMEEGLENRWHRHEQTHQALRSGLSKMGLEFASQPGHQLWQLNAVQAAEGVDEAAVRKRLLSDFNIEVGAGLGPMKGKIWRVGLMGETASRENVLAFLSALGKILNDLGRKTDVDAALSAAKQAGQSN